MQRLRIIPLVVGLIAAAIGIGVMVSYRRGDWSFILVRNFPMQFNTALCMLFAGAATAVAAWRNRRWIAILGALDFAVGAITLSEHMLRADYGIDQLLNTSQIPGGDIYPGRMSPNTALMFVFLGIILCIWNLAGATWWRTTLMALLALSIIGVAGIVATAHWSPTTMSIYGGGQVTRMAPHTALLFIAFGLTFLILAIAERPSDMRLAVRPFAGPIGSMFIIACVLFLWIKLAQREHYRLGEMTRAAANAVRSHVQAKLDASLDSLTRFTLRWESANEMVPESIWSGDARMFLSHFPHIDSLYMTDSLGRFRWGVAAVNASSLDRPTARLAFEEVAQLKPDDRRIILSPIETTADDDQALLALLPVFFNGQFDGALVAEIHPHLIFDSTLDQLKLDQNISLYSSGTAVYHRVKETNRFAASLRQRHHLPLRSAHWEFEIWPDRATLLREETPLTSISLAGGLAIAVLLGMVISLAQASQAREAEASDAYRRLEAEAAIRKAAELRLRDSLDRLNFHVDNSPLGFVEWDSDFRLVQWSRRAEEIFGWPAAEVMGKRPEEWRFIFDDDIETVRPIIAGLLDGSARRVRTSCRNYTKDGRMIYCEWFTSTRVDVEGRMFSIQSAVLDVTDRVRALESLKASQKQYLELAEAMPQIVWTADAEGNVDYLNRRWYEYTGLDPMTDQTGPGDALHPDDAISCLESWKESMKGGSDWEMEFRLRRGADQMFRWHLGRSVAARDSQGRVARWLGTSTDIHDQKVVEDELRRLMETLELRVAERTAAAEQANMSKSEFLANMSHEIRTPMTAILGFADILIDESVAMNAAPQFVENLNTIKRNALHLLDIINGILDLSKIESGKLELERINISPRKLAEDAHALMTVRAQAKGLPFRLSVREPIPPNIVADPTRVRQILINLLGNAIKFTETGSVELRLARDSSVGDHGILRFDVIDTGIGMNDEETARLFQPFSQADASMTRKFGGTGLGLSISRRLARMMGGDVVVHSQPGAGSTFSLSIPVTTPPANEPTSQPPVNNLMKRETDSARFADLIALKCRILLAEDGPDNQRLISFHLRKIATEVALAENGQIAVDLAMAAWRVGRPYDVILMDMQMPELDGYGAATRLREFGYRGPIIALTAHAMAGDRQRCLDAGCDGYATKPIDRQELLTQIADLLGKPVS